MEVKHAIKNDKIFSEQYMYISADDKSSFTKTETLNCDRFFKRAKFPIL